MNIRYVSGAYEMCMANVHEGETYEEVGEMPDNSIAYTSEEIQRYAIKQTRSIAFISGFTFSVDGKSYPCDPVFQEAVKTYLTAYMSGVVPEEYTVRIRRSDNTFWYPNYTELKPFAAELMQHIESVWTDYWAAKDAL